MVIVLFGFSITKDVTSVRYEYLMARLTAFLVIFLGSVPRSLSSNKCFIVRKAHNLSNDITVLVVDVIVTGPWKPQQSIVPENDGPKIYMLNKYTEYPNNTK